MSAAMVEARGLSRSFGGRTVVHPLDLEVARGEVHGLLGANGAGKTTTLRMLATLLAPTAGEARIAGHDVARAPRKARAALGFVGDEACGAFASWSVREYLGHFAALRGVPGEVEARLDDVGLDAPHRGRALGALSVGMQRRVELARALLGSPPVLLLDEPTRGLDIPGRHATWALLRGLRTRGTAILLSSHDAGEILALCDGATLVRGGRAVDLGDARRLGADPARLEARLADLMAPVGP